MENIEFMPFSLGSIVATPGVIEIVPEYRLLECLYLHKNGDWGKVCAEDAVNNNLSTHNGYRILSAYPIDPTLPCKGYGENCLWIITEADRSATTFLLPEEY